MGSGTEVSEINKLIKLYRQTSDMMKKFGKKGMLDQDLGVQDIDKSEINKLNDSKLSEKMLSDLQNGSADQNYLDCLDYQVPKINYQIY